MRRALAEAELQRERTNGCSEAPPGAVSVILRKGRADDPSRVVGTGRLDRRTVAFYREAINTLDAAGVPFLVGGAYALAHYVGVTRHTRDFDVFLRRTDVARALDALADSGCRTEITFPHWLGKAMRAGDLVDIIFSSGNGVADVDDVWFERSVQATVFGATVRLVPAEEVIWSKAFIMERERFDGADVAHMLHALADKLDWPHLLYRFGPHWRVLLTHLVLHGFIYPDERGRIPAWVEDELLQRLVAERDQREPQADEKLCYGTLLSRAQYIVDVSRWGYRDARMHPHGPLSEHDIEIWTAAIAKR